MLTKINHLVLHSNSLSERGDGTNAIEWAHLSKVAGFGYSVAVPSHALVADVTFEALDSFGVSIIRYRNKSELQKKMEQQGASHLLVFSDGGSRAPAYTCGERDSFRVAGTKHITQVVFRNNDVHGDLYLYVSPWLFEATNRIGRHFSDRLHTVVSFLHHSVPTKNELPADSLQRSKFMDQFDRFASGRKVIFRAGGLDQFDDPAARSGIQRFLDRNPDYVFIAANTREFSHSSRVLTTGPISRQDVLWAIRNSTATVNGRRMGESFGLGIYESLNLETPVLAPSTVRNPLMDKNHIRALGDSRFLYRSSGDFARKLESICEQPSLTPHQTEEAANSLRSTVAKKFLDLVEQLHS